MANNLSFCASQVKNNDYYRYICCLFTPEILRMRLFTLYAFNIEIAKIKELVSEPMTGLIRLTWWREAIDEIYKNKQPRNHPLLEHLAELIKTTDIPRTLLEKILDTYEDDLGFSAMIDSKDLKKYIEGTSVAMLNASLYVIGADSEAARDAAYYIGTAYAITGIMRRAKWDASKRHIMFPKEMLIKHGITEDDISEGRNFDKTNNLVRELCDKVEVNLRHAKALQRNFSPHALPIYLHTTIASCFLKRIKKNKYDIFKSDLEKGKLEILIRIFFDAKFNTHPVA